ncbi:MAG TPA: SRPBCC family protein [Actinopolymorphaceae bacterium]|nr:SRPBCC family protein [Actinopolymorphaceae bacterium]
MTKQADPRTARSEITVNVPVEKAFEVFTNGIDTWWPRDHHIGAGKLDKEIIEPRVGGRCYGREADGTVCPWGTVVAWDPPRHFAVAWQITLAWTYEPDVERSSRVDVEFTADGPERTHVVLVHSDFERYGTGWESMRDSVGSAGGWPGGLRLFAAAAEAQAA